MGSESFPFLFSFAGDGALTGHTGLTKSADCTALVTVSVMADGGDEFLVVGLAFYLVVAPFFGDGTGGAAVNAGGAAFVCQTVFVVAGVGPGGGFQG